MSQTKQREAMMNDYLQNPYNIAQEPLSARLKKFAYDPATGAIFGRTPSSWGKIGLFYIIFYICLACLFAVCMWVFYLTLDPRKPTWRLDESLIGTNPALGFRPMPNDTNSLSTLIWYKGTAEKDYAYWKESLETFLDVYKIQGKTPGRGENIYSCNYDQLPPRGKVCDIDWKQWDPCNYRNNFNYHLQSPCIFIKLNKIYGWIPEFYNDTTALPEKMPKNLTDTIKRIGQENKLSLNTVWVSCEGENPADVENIGEVRYYPKPGFPGYFFPYENSVGYLSPLVAVHFVQPKNGILINVECKAWAKNIKHDRKEKIGVVHFELMLD